MAARTPEGQLKAKCRVFARKHGLLFANVEGKSFNGFPDTVCGKYPKGSGIIFIEFKRPGQEPTEQQMKRLDELVDAGAKANWSDSFEWYLNLIGYDPDL